MVNMEDEKLFKGKHHVATGPFSFFEIEVETTIKNYVAQGRWLALQFKSEQK